jgi:hypothetical protein
MIASIWLELELLAKFIYWKIPATCSKALYNIIASDELKLQDNELTEKYLEFSSTNVRLC